MNSFFYEKKKPFTPTVFLIGVNANFAGESLGKFHLSYSLKFWNDSASLLMIISRQSVCIEREIKKFLDCRQNWCLVDRNHESWIISCTQSAITNQSRSTLSRVERPHLRCHPFASLNIWTLHFSSENFLKTGRVVLLERSDFVNSLIV